MSADRQKEIARKGGKAAHECGKAHEFTTDEARAAGRKGGEAVSANRSHMSEIGRLGGLRSARRRASSSHNGGRSAEGHSTEPIHGVDGHNGTVHGHMTANAEDAHAHDVSAQPQTH